MSINEISNKNVGLLTLGAGTYNYGGFLQELALQEAIMQRGFNCEVLDYEAVGERNTFSVRRGIKNLTYEKFIEIIKGRLNRLKPKEQVPNVVKRCGEKRRDAFDTYRDSHLILSELLCCADLYGKRLPYDAIVCGSDQIWNPDFNIPSFFLGFAKEDQRKVIYAASIGKESLTKLQLKTYADLMKGLDYISVREHSAKEILQPVAEQPITVVLDPTLLHSRAYWEEKAAESTKRYKNYVFCYFLDMTEEKVLAAKAYAETRGCELVQIPYLHGRYEPLCEKLGGIMDSDVNPADFLKLILDAECVLTDSFHAAVFSLLFQKDFWVFGRMAGNYNMNTRLDTLLGYFGAEDRMIRPQDLMKQKYGPVTVTEDVLQPMRDVSFEFLKKALE